MSLFLRSISRNAVPVFAYHQDPSITSSCKPQNPGMPFDNDFFLLRRKFQDKISMLRCVPVGSSEVDYWKLTAVTQRFPLSKALHEQLRTTVDPGVQRRLKMSGQTESDFHTVAISESCRNLVCS